MDAIISMFGLTTPPIGMEWMLYMVKAFLMAFFITFLCNWIVALVKQMLMKRY